MDYPQDTKYPTTLSGGEKKDIIVTRWLAGMRRHRTGCGGAMSPERHGAASFRSAERGQVVIIETPYDEDIIILQRESTAPCSLRSGADAERRTEDKTRSIVQVAAPAPVAGFEWRAISTSERGYRRSGHPATATWSAKSRRAGKTFPVNGRRMPAQPAGDEAGAARR